MQLQFKAPMCKAWILEDDRILIGNQIILLRDVTGVSTFNTPTKLTNGVISKVHKNEWNTPDCQAHLFGDCAGRR